MQQMLDIAAFMKIQISCNRFNVHPPPEHPVERIFGVVVKISFRKMEVAYGTDHFFSPDQRLPATQAQVRKKQAEKVAGSFM
jgi:hypothetical protein